MKRGFPSRAAPPLHWLSFHPALLLAGYAMIGAPLQAEQPKKLPALEELAAICRDEPSRRIARIMALPIDQRIPAAMFCSGYQRGADDLLRVLQGDGADVKRI